MSNKLTEALAALEKVKKGEGVVTMDAAELTDYAQEQILKSGQDEDDGAARIAALTEVVTEATELFKSDPAAKYEFVPFSEAPEPGSNEALAKSVDSMTTKLDELISTLRKQNETDNEAGNPTDDTVHPPPVPDADGSAVATNQPQGDDGTPRGDLVKSDDDKDKDGEGDNAAAKSDDDKDKDKDGKDVAKADADEDENFVWPVDLNTEDFRKGVTKREEQTERPTWGYDNEPAPVS